MQNHNKKPNHLVGQSSPYLLQHLYNPVDWHPWGEDALSLAKAQNKPLLVSIGYSACHWCHVMERESFQDTEVARLMNQNFICIKVDREERPDIDHLYMNAVQMVSGQGGWPLNCFALPDGRPFWGGTYFPREQWKNVLIRVAELFYNRRNDVEDQADQLTEGIADSSFIRINSGKAAFSRDEVQLIFENIMTYMDTENGGTKGAPKFPLPNIYEFLLHYHFHSADPKAIEQVSLTLRKMSMGGIYDQIGGGFSRYSTDTEWKVPHFEKMLYDNAQLISLYSNVYKEKGDKLFRKVVEETVSFVKRELTSPDGLFYSALDADSDGEEGKFYVWTEAEFEDILKADAVIMKEYFHLGNKGLWENGKNILIREESDQEFAARHSIDEKELEKKLEWAKGRLFEARCLRTRPGLDDKILVSWNAMMIRGLADAYAAFEVDAYLKMAIRAMEALLKKASKEGGGLYRNLKKDSPPIASFLEDYAWLINALIRLFEVTSKEGYLLEAARLAEYALMAFGAEDTSLLAFSAKDQARLAAPYFEFHDNVMPASNSVMAKNLFYLAHYFENPVWGQRSSEMLRDMQKLLGKYSRGYSNWGVLLMHHTYPFYTLVACGQKTNLELKKALKNYAPNARLAFSSDEQTKIEVFKDRFKPNQTWFYVCQMGMCKLPVKTLKEAMEQMTD